jgi:hypothetical protein
LIRRMSMENPLWGAPRIHGELLKLGFEIAQSSVAKYMAKPRGPSSQGWRSFLRNHAPNIAAMDLFVVPTIGFDLLCALVIVRLDRRELVWINQLGTFGEDSLQNEARPLVKGREHFSPYPLIRISFRIS